MEQKIISILGPSGGIGKSTLAKELAIAFSKTAVNGQSLSVCVVDTNLVFGSQKVLFGVLPRFTVEDWLFQIRNANQPDDVNVRYYSDWQNVEKFLSYNRQYDVYLLPSPSNGHYFEITTRELNIMLQSLRNFFDIIVIDTGNNLEQVTVASMILSDINVLIATDEIRTTTNVKKLRKRARDEKIPLDKFVAVINKYPDIRDGRLFSKDELETILYMDIPVIIPQDKRVWAMNNTQGAIVLEQNHSKTKKSILDLAQILIPEVNPRDFY